jgi:Secretion system C-terminal sorting domain
MKQFYPFATILLATLTLSFATIAQTYSGGTYTAVRTGYNWHTPSGPNAWDPNGEPPANCSNCLITINSGVTVTLNTSVTLSNSSMLVIGTDPASAAELRIIASNGSGWANSYNIIILNDNSNPANAITLPNSSAFINATAADNTFDGIFTTFNGTSPITYNKQFGTGVSAYVGTTVSNSRSLPASDGTLTGPSTLTSPGTLPIIMFSFTGTLDNNTVDLAWTTEQEVNSDYFGIERSIDGGNTWKQLGTVTASGFSSTPVNYTFTDASPATGANEYRIRSVDRDGKYAYSAVQVVRVGLVSKVSLFPNPAKDNVNITLTGGSEATNVTIRLISQSGQVLAEKQVTASGTTTVSLAVGGYPQGNYVVLVSGSDGTQQTSKLVIVKQ